MTVGQNLKELRLKRNKTLEDVADYLHTSPQTIFKYENGIVKNIPMKKIVQICRYLDIHPSSVMDWEDEKDADTMILSISEQLMLEEYRKLTPMAQEAVDALIHSLVDIEKQDKGSAKHKNEQLKL